MAELERIWPPPIIPWENDWAAYSEKIYATYKETYNQDSPFFFEGLPVRTRKKPIENGKEGGFWHLIGGNENVPKRERCERVAWARIIIENYQNDEILVWEEPSRHDGNATDVIFWAQNLNYCAVLGRRNGYWLLRSAYFIEFESKKQNLLKAYSKHGSYKN